MNIAGNLVEEKDLQYINREAKRNFEKLASHSVLLIGAGGFLGYYFTKSILMWNEENPKKKIRLSVLSTFKSGIPDWMMELSKKKKLELIRKDITVYMPPRTKHYDYIIHAASIASPTYYRLHPIETINANVKGLYNVLEYMINQKNNKKPVKGLLFFSTSEIYGDPTPGNIPTPEEYRGNVSCTGPRACYDESKRFCETLCVNYARVHNLPIKSARPFNNYGPGLKIDDKRVIPDIAKNILSGKDITLFSSGKPSRTFCYVADAINGYLKILTNGKKGEAYNIGTSSPEVTVLELAERMKKIAADEWGYKGKIKYTQSSDKEYLTDNPQRRCPSILKAKKELKYEPGISLEEGLSRTMLWYKETLK